MEIDVELLSFISEVLHLNSAFVKITLVSNEDFNRIWRAGSRHSFVVVRDTFERRGHVNCIDNNDSVSSLEGVVIMSTLRRGFLTKPNVRRVPNVQLYLFWLSVLNSAGHIHDFAIVSDADGWLGSCERILHKLVNDRGLADA